MSVRPSVFFPVGAMKSYRPEKSDRSERSSKISGRCDEIVPTGKISCLSDRQFFLFVLPGTGLWAAGVFAIVGPFATEAEFWQSFGQIMIFGFVGNDLANDLAVTPANFLLPRQKYSTTKK